jgi:RNA-directed DNA polymerase
VSLVTPAKLRTLQRALYATAKREPARRFHTLYDKVWREDILAHAFALSRENGGAPGVDGVSFAQIEAYGVARWLAELREEVRTGRYSPQLLKGWLKVPVVEPDERGAQRRESGKRATRGTPQGGVVSPLLANIYMHRYIKAFRRHGLDQKYGAQLVTYADDLVVLCRQGAHEVLEKTRGWMGSIGLALNEEKTSVRDARCESFDFLGYTFGPMYSPRTGGRYNGARPSKKAIASIKGAIRQQLRNGNQAPWPEVVSRLNRTVRGWAAYFCYGSLAKARHDVQRHLYHTVRRFLRRRHKVTGPGYRQFPEAAVFGELGVLALNRLPRLALRACRP